jgi:hypothetical protein
VASTGTINIGGVNDYHHILFPETATCDSEILENKVSQYIDDKEKYLETINYAWLKVNEVFSFEAVKKQIESIK